MRLQDFKYILARVPYLCERSSVYFKSIQLVYRFDDDVRVSHFTSDHLHIQFLHRLRDSQGRKNQRRCHYNRKKQEKGLKFLFENVLYQISQNNHITRSSYSFQLLLQE